jgi:HprK-related kinase A
LGTVSNLSESSFSSLLSGDGLGVQIGPFNARIQTNVTRLFETLYQFYKDYPLLEDGNVFSIHSRLQSKRAFPKCYRRMVRFTVDGRQPHADMPAEHALPVLEWGLNLAIALRSHCFLMLHCAVLERNGNALLLPAAPGDGKTTLCVGLSFRGWRTLSDEFGLIRPDSRDLIPVPRPMALKNSAIDVIKEFAPDAYIGPATPNTRKGTVAHAKPTMESIAQQSVTAPATMIVFPRWQAGVPLSLQEMTKAEGFMFLATNAFNYELLGEAAFRTVRDLIKGARCFRLVYSDLEEATARLAELSDANG